MFSKIQKIFFKHKNLILLTITVALSALAISVVMWKLLDSHNKSNTNLTHKNNPELEMPLVEDGKTTFFYENAKNNLEKYANDNTIEKDKDVKEMNFYSIAVLNDAFNQIGFSFVKYDAFNRPHIYNEQNTLNNILLILNDLKKEYLIEHKDDTVQIIITSDIDLNKITITQLYPLKQQSQISWFYEEIV